MHVKALAQHHFGPRERARRVADTLGESRGHVAAGMHTRAVGPERIVERGHGRQRLVLDAQRVERVLGLGGALGDEESHRLPGVRDDLLGQDLGTGRRHQARVRDEQRQPPERGDV